jgi:hypothetical protein
MPQSKVVSIHPKSREAQDIQTLENLVPLTREELDGLYAGASANNVPKKITEGKAIFFAGSPLTAPLSRIARYCWQGKTFNSSGDALINRILGFEAVRAKVYRDVSWYDGKEAIIVDYSDTSLLFGKIRDEIREIRPGIYLGKAYLRPLSGDRKGRLLLDFALDARA